MEVSVRVLSCQKSISCLRKGITVYICTCLAFLLCIHGSDSIEEIYLKNYNETVDYSPNLFQNFDQILKFFLREEYRHEPFVKNAINIFRDECTKYKVKPPLSGRRKPFIAIEAVHRSTRRIIARQLATLLRGSMLQNPPKCLHHLRPSFNTGPLKRGFHALSIYASGFIARRVVSHYPVIMNGYWFDQISFSVVRTFLNYSLPPVECKVYDWPRDLIPPDIIFLVVNEKRLFQKPYAEITRRPDDIMIQMLEVCRRMRGVPVVELDTVAGFTSTIGQIKNEIEKRFTDVFDFYFNDYQMR